MTDPHASRRRTQRTILVLVLLFASLYSMLRHTPVMTPPQGRAYIRAAAAVVDGRGLEGSPGVPLAWVTPLYAIALVPFSLAGLEVVPSVYLLNCFALAAGLLGFYWLAREIHASTAGLATALYSLWGVHYYLLRAARPDGLAIALTLLTLAALLQYHRTQRVLDLAPVAILACLASLCRYMTALTLLPVLGIAVLCLTRQSGRIRCVRAIATVSIAGLPFGIWLVRNLLVSGHLFGMSRTAPRIMAQGNDLATNVSRLAETMAVDLFNPDAMGTLAIILGELPLPYTSWVVIASLAAMMAVAFAALRGRSGARPACFSDPRAVVFLGYPAFYVVALLALWTIGNNDPIHTRFVAPVYPFVALGALSLTTRVAQDRVALAAAMLAVLLVLVPSCVKSIGLLANPPDANLLELQGRKENVYLWRSHISWASGRSRPPAAN